MHLALGDPATYRFRKQSTSSRSLDCSAIARRTEYHDAVGADHVSDLFPGAGDEGLGGQTTGEFSHNVTLDSRTQVL